MSTADGLPRPKPSQVTLLTNLVVVTQPHGLGHLLAVCWVKGSSEYIYQNGHSDGPLSQTPFTL
jgi:hypothetical protein